MGRALTKQMMNGYDVQPRVSRAERAEQLRGNAAAQEDMVEVNEQGGFDFNAVASLMAEDEVTPDDHVDDLAEVWVEEFRVKQRRLPELVGLAKQAKEAVQTGRKAPYVEAAQGVVEVLGDYGEWWKELEDDNGGLGGHMNVTREDDLNGQGVLGYQQLEDEGADLSKLDALRNGLFTEALQPYTGQGLGHAFMPSVYQGDRTHPLPGVYKGSNAPTGGGEPDDVCGAYVRWFDGWPKVYEEILADVPDTRRLATRTNRTPAETDDATVEYVNQTLFPDSDPRRKAYLGAVFKDIRPGWTDHVALDKKDTHRLHVQDQAPGQDIDWDKLDGAVGDLAGEGTDTFVDEDVIREALEAASTDAEREYIFARLQASGEYDEVYDNLPLALKVQFDATRSNAGMYATGLGEANDVYSLGDAVGDTFQNLTSLMEALRALPPFAAVDMLLEISASATRIVWELVTSERTWDVVLIFLAKVNNPALVARWLASVTVDDIRALLYKAASVGALAAFFGACMMFNRIADVLPGVLKGLSYELLMMVWDAAPQGLKDMLVDGFKTVWPEDFGVNLEVALGATFGVPLHVGQDSYLEAIHDREGQVSLRRGGITTFAVDTGVGVGGGFSNGKGTGLGGEAGAEVMGGVRLVVHEEYGFDLTQDRQLVAFMLEMTSLQANPLDAARLFGEGLTQLDPAGYLTKTKTELKQFVDGNAAVTAGKRSNMKDRTEDGAGPTREEAAREGWNQADGVKSAGDKTFLQLGEFLKLSARIALEAGVGIELDQVKQKDKDGRRVLESADLSFYGQVGGLANVNLGPLAGILPLPAFDGVGGVKATWGIKVKEDGTFERADHPKITAFKSTGDGDRWEGAYDETEMELIDMSKAGEAIANLDPAKAQEVIDGLGSLTYKTRFSFPFATSAPFNAGDLLGTKFNKTVARQGSFQTFLKSSYKLPVTKIEAHGSLHSELPREDVHKTARILLESSQEYQKDPKKLVSDLTGAVTGAGSSKTWDTLEAQGQHVYESLKENVKEVKIRVEFGVGGAGGGKAKAGASVRLDVRGVAQLVWEKDILKDTELTVNDIEQMVKGWGSAAASAVTP